MKQETSHPGKIRLLAVIALVALAGSACRKQEANSNVEVHDTSAVQLQVSTAPVVERNAIRSIEVVGSLEAEDEVTVSSQASGNLDEITVDVGSAVKAGQTIARLDQRELKLKVDQAEAALRQAEARLGVRRGERVDPNKQPDVRQAAAGVDRARYDLNASRDLVEHGDISKQQLDVYQKTFEQAEARHEAALENVRNLEAVLEEKRAQCDLAKKQLTDVAIVSPITGVVKQKLASRGEYLQPGKPVATIVQINPLRLKLEVPETFATNISRGQTVTLKVDSFAERQFKGQIKRISPSLDEKSRSLMAEAEVSNTDGALKPGMFARAQIVSDSSSVALMVPEKAVVSLAGVTKVFVVEGDRAIERQVKLGAKDGTLIEILEGVKLGEKVVTSDAEKLHDGSSVTAS
jgi:membrane fusion protein, multidrug efflux system